jgi:hypothetical protein
MTIKRPVFSSSPPLRKGGQGGFFPIRWNKSPSILLFQRGRQCTEFLRVVAVLVFLVAPALLRAQNLPAGEKQKIETLIKQVGALKNAKFVRNGATYEPATAVKFLRGKWDANKADVRSARDFIDKVASRSETSGKSYLIRFNDGKEVKSSDFLLAELKKLES